MTYDVGSIERYLRRRLAEPDRRRFDRAKRFVDGSAMASASDASAHRARARWLRFLCGRAPVRRDIWPNDLDFLRHFARLFGLQPADTREFVRLSFFGQLWRASSFLDLMAGPPGIVAQLTEARGWDRFDRCQQDGAGVILLLVHGQFSRLLLPYLRHRGHDGLKVGIAQDELAVQGFRTPAAQRLELARQMHAAKHHLGRGGIVFNLPDDHRHLDNSRPVEFFGRRRTLAAGFAELALKTGARVLPVAHRFSPRGFFVLDLGAPLRDPGPRSTPAERIDALVAQYASFLRDEWERYPWNIQWKQLRYYCGLPGIDAGALGDTARAIGAPAQAVAR